MKKLTDHDYAITAFEFGLDSADVKTVVAVESGGVGFDSSTGKIIIQFEPSWFKRKSPYTPSGKWSLNQVERQVQEWEAFNDAFKKDASAAMESTSIGLMQVMGFHYKLLGFRTVDEMWDFAKISEVNQLRLGLSFIRSNPAMFSALKNHKWAKFAFYYNGEQYQKFNYDKRLETVYTSLKK